MTESVAGVTDEVISTLQYEKSVMKGHIRPGHDVYERLADYSDLSDPAAPKCTLLRSDRDGIPRRTVFDSVVLEIDGVDTHLVRREEPFRALWTYEFGLDFDSTGLALEGAVKLRPEGLGNIGDVNACVDPMDTDVWAVSSLGDTVYHTLMAGPELLPPGSEFGHDFVTDYAGDLCISPHYERLVETVLGARCLDGVMFAYPNDAPGEEVAIAEAGIGVYLAVTGPAAREHGLVLDKHLFPSETVPMENVAEAMPAAETIRRAIASPELETELKV